MSTSTVVNTRAIVTRNAGRGRPVAPSPGRSRAGIIQVVLGILVAALILLYLSPIIWLVVTSFKDRVDIFSSAPSLFFTPTLENYRQAFLEKGFTDNLLNSTIVGVVSTGIALLVGVPAAYSLSRARKGETFMMALLAARLLPAMVLAVPLFVLASSLGVRDSYFALIAAHLTFALPFTVWMMRGFFLAVPISLDEAARLDGCGEWGTFLRVILPIVKPGLASTGIFCLINSWNEFLFALVLTGRHTQTLPVAIPSLITPIGTSWGQVAAVGTVTILPVLIIAFIVQKHIVAGMTGGAVSAE
ncbi:carbohydrate ABC transporter permease [Microbacterium sp. MYb66]|jgi:multiple sugar transport system permease protein|uniref:carbohydrate ABC transporter permease n=1 Tax=Microbacterium sp. MYb66 TaxID=1848692 RepID=UPI000D008C43|nr:carbohydrate ABC transporter permease [Microbacterium sp. MYb66]PRA81215.1 ABC transporter permease [Microbacterium sp. MYb66]